MFSMPSDPVILTLVMTATGAIRTFGIDADEARSIALLVVGKCLAAWGRNPQSSPQDLGLQRGYVRAAARNAAISHVEGGAAAVRAGGAEDTTEGREPDPVDSAYLDDLERRVYGHLLAVLTRMPPDDREIVLARSEGFSYRKIAGRLKFRHEVDTVRKRCARATLRLHRKLDAAGLTDDADLACLRADSIWQRLREHFGFESEQDLTA